MQLCKRVFAILWLGLMSLPAFSQTIRIAVFEDQIPFFNTMLADDPCPAFDSADFGLNQMLLEYLFVCHALLEADASTKLRLVGLPVVHRVVEELAAGNADVSGFGVWSAEASNHQIYQSEPLLQKGEFTKGLYVSQKTRQRLNNGVNTDLSKLVAVSNKNWTYDWAALECAGMQVIHVDHYEQMFSVVGAGRADVLAMAFGLGEVAQREEFGIKLFPLTQIKMRIPDSNHVLVSKRHPKAASLVKSLDSGIKAMRTSLSLRERYQQAGVLNPYVSEWTGICAR